MPIAAYSELARARAREIVQHVVRELHVGLGGAHAIRADEPTKSQTNGFSPVCERLCTSNGPTCAKVLPQPSWSQAYACLWQQSGQNLRLEYPPHAHPPLALGFPPHLSLQHLGPYALPLVALPPRGNVEPLAPRLWRTKASPDP